MNKKYKSRSIPAHFCCVLFGRLLGFDLFQNLGQQFFGSGLGGLSLGFFFCLSMAQFTRLIEGFQNKKDHKSDQQKINHCAYKAAQTENDGFIDHFTVNHLCRPQYDVQSTHIPGTADPAYEGHQQIVHQRAGDLTESGSDDNADSHIQHVAPHDEFFEFFHEFFHRKASLSITFWE